MKKGQKSSNEIHTRQTNKLSKAYTVDFKQRVKHTYVEK